MKRMKKPTHVKRRRGVTVVLTAISITTLLLFASLAVDVGWICTLTAEMQNTADGGALAGAIALQDGDDEFARRRALNIIARNQKNLGFRSMDDQIAELGTWNSVTREFVALDPEDWGNAFAVRSDAPLFFAALMGKHSTTVWREAIAVGSKPCQGIWGISGVSAGSITTDSYDSTDGPYSSLTAADNGDLCSGSYIDVRGSFDINGDVMAAFGDEVTVSGSAGDISGMTTSSIMTPVPYPSVEFGDVATVNDNATIGLTDEGRSPWKGGGWNMDIQGTDNLTLAGGTYYLDSFSLSGGSSVTITAKTTLYEVGSWDSRGGTVVNEDQDPGNLTIISSGTEMKIAGGSSFFGSILAPYADIVFSGGADIYGAVVGGTVKLSGDMTFHLDESLPLAQPLFEPPPPMLAK